MENNKYNSEDGFQEIFSRSADLMCVLDLSYRFLAVNTEWQSTFRYTNVELAGKMFTDIVIPGEIKYIKEKLNDIVSGKNDSRFYGRVMIKNGAYHLLSMDASSDDSQIIISGTIISEEQQKEYFTNLFKASVDLSFEGVYWINREGRFVYVNARAASMLGYTKEELMQISLFDLDANANRYEYDRAMLKYEETGNVPVIPMERYHRMKDGTLLPVEITVNYMMAGEEAILIVVSRDITERKRQEEEIARKQNLLNESQRVAQTGSWEYNLTDGSVLWSDSTYRIYGLESAGQIASEELFLSCVHPDDRDYVKERILICIDQGEINNEECRIVLKNGEVRTIATNAKVVKGPDGLPDKLVGIVQDVTDRKKADEALRKSEQKLLSMFNTSPVGIGVTAGRIIIDVNPQVSKITGYPREELIGKKTEILYASEKEYRETGDDIYRQLEENGIGSAETIIKKKDGTLAYIIIALSPIDPGDYSKGFTFSVQDISERKKYEEELLKNQAILVESQRIARMGSWELILKGEKLFWNRETYIIYGYEPDEVDPTLQTFFDLLNPDSLEVARNHFNNTLVTKVFEDFECNIITPGGIEKTLLIAGEVVLDNRGNPVKFFGIVQDITENKKHEEQLILAKEKAEESDKLKTAFLANLSHEIRTPMNGILGFAELLKSTDLSKSIQDSYIHIIEESGQRMLRLINDLVDISRIEANQVDLSPEKTNLNNLINKLYQFFAPIAGNKGLTLSVKHGLADDNCLIIIDNLKLEQILTNLLTNAIKFTSMGKVHFEYSVSGDKLMFRVSDTGKGIPAGMTDVIFERFRQADNSYSSGYEGTGLGLSISKAFVELMGGTIWVESVEGAGAEFIFTLPYFAVEETKEEKQDKPESAYEFNKGMLILVAEDDPVSFRYLHEVLRKNHFEVLHAKDGREAVKLFTENSNIRLILMDMRMPYVDGVQATREIRKLSDKVPIIAQTAYVSENDLKNAFAAGCNDFLKKPVDKSEMLSKMNGLLQ